MDSDLHLLSRYHRHGDAAAFQQLVDAHVAMVHATAWRTTRDAALASDVVQETFLALARAGGGAVQSVGAWLHQVAVRKAANLVRSESRRRVHEIRAADHLHQPPEETAWSEIEPVLDEALAALPEETRTLLVEHFLERRTQSELAQSLGLSQSTVSRRIEGALEMLRTALHTRGVTCGAGFGALLLAHTSSAVPAALTSSLSKLALSGAGAAAASLTLPKLLTSLLMTTTGKIALTAGALLTAVTLGNHLASPAGETKPVSLPSGSAASSVSTIAAPPAAIVTPRQNLPTPAALPKNSPSPITAPTEVGTKLLALTSAEDFRAFVAKAFSLRDADKMAAEIKRVIGLEVRAEDLRSGATSPSVLEMMLISRLAAKHPQELLSWLALYDGSIRSYSGAALYQIAKYHPQLTASAAEAFLPEGPNRALILSLLRAQADPLAEARHTLTTMPVGQPRQELLYHLADTWPYSQISEGTRWALANLSGHELEACLPRLAQRLSTISPDEAISLLSQIQKQDLLSRTLVDTMHGLVVQQPRMDAVTAVISRLQGEPRRFAISELSRRWVRADQEGLMQWINGLESAEDFEAALPLTLPQLSATNYRAAMDALIPQLDGKLDAALLKAATPDIPGHTRTTMDIIRRLTSLPQYRSIGSGQQGNQELLWVTINRAASQWIKTYGAPPQDGAAWIDSLPFRSPADKATVATQLYQQWKPIDPAAASKWAASAGVKIR